MRFYNVLMQIVIGGTESYKCSIELGFRADAGFFVKMRVTETLFRSFLSGLGTLYVDVFTPLPGGREHFNLTL